VRFITFVLLVFPLMLSPLAAQDFGFGFGDESAGDVSGGTAGAFAVSIGGEVSASVVGYAGDFQEGAGAVELGDLFSGKLNFAAETSRADAVINLKLRTQADSPVTLDEAYVRAYFGNFDIEGGLRKLTWGKADSLGPLDVINPLDYSDFAAMSDMKSDPMTLKIARPLIHTSYRIGSFSKIEGVFVPNFEPARFGTGRWTPGQMERLDQLEVNGVPVNRRPSGMASLDYAQAGVRFTTTIGPADIGLQYYYGRLTKPAFSMTPSPLSTEVNFSYNPYHQIGADWAQVLFGFNVRAEAAANITSDLDGDDGSIYNPSLACSFGFDRDLLLGINLNLQVNESIAFMHGRINSDPLLDTEADTNTTSTQIIASLSKTFFRDELEAMAAVIWEVEARDFLIMPSLVWTKDTVSVQLSGGIFGGDEDGQFGQYRDNGFVKAALTYSF
jgi:hypothetical protein